VKDDFFHRRDAEFAEVFLVLKEKIKYLCDLSASSGAGGENIKI
jgi:hypothetical protein